MKTELHNTIIGFVLVLTLVCTLSGCSKKTYSIDEDKPNIVCDTCEYDVVAHITVEKTYMLKGEKYNTIYFEFDKPVSKDTPYIKMGSDKLYSSMDVSYSSPEFDMSETDYNRYFGNGNDAFETTVYEIKAEADIIKYKEIFGDTDIDKLETGLEDGIYNYTAEYTDSTKWADNKATVEINTREDTATGYISKYHFSIFGESSFTKKEVSQTKKNILSMGHKFIETNLNDK